MQYHMRSDYVQHALMFGALLLAAVDKFKRMPCSTGKSTHGQFRLHGIAHEQWHHIARCYLLELAVPGISLPRCQNR